MKSITVTPRPDRARQHGFSVVEILIVTVIISTLFIGISQAFQNVARTYTLTRQLNEMYAVLSSCPEVDRALDYTAIVGATNCFPNNVFRGEGPGGATITYLPTLAVLSTTAPTTLPVSDPLYGTYDSKVIDVSVGRPGSNDLPWRIRLLVTRNGIAQ